MNSYILLTVGKTQESTEAQEFKRYIGVGSSYVLAVNPSKEELENIYGTEQKEPEYVVDGENGKEARIHFIVKTDPEANNGIELISRLMFTLRATPAYNRDETKVQVIDGYGNSTWASVEDAKAGAKLLSSEGKELRIDTKYRMACVGEADLVGFLKKYLRVQDVFDYKNGSWVKKPNAEDYAFSLDHIKDYFNGNFSELKEALALQPGNKVKLLYGVRTAETENGPRQYQAVASRADLIMPNNAGAKSIERLEKNLANIKANGSYPNTEFKVQDLEEWTIEPTNLEKKTDDDPFGAELPWT
jgi:hypothetical protein